MDNSKHEIPDALPFDQALWGKNRAALNHANCYIYALGDSALVLPLVSPCVNPGVISGESYYDLTAAAITQSAIGDGLQLTGDELRVMPGCYPVALLVLLRRNLSLRKKVKDYHWIRMNPNGTWSEKCFGLYPATVWDRDGKTVRDPKASGIIGGYSFVAYFNVPRTLSMDSAEILRRMDATDRRAEKETKCMLAYGEESISLKERSRQLEEHKNNIVSKAAKNAKFILPPG